MNLAYLNVPMQFKICFDNTILKTRSMYVYIVMYFFFHLCLGYYADPEMGCQAYHVCLLDPLGGSMYPTSFLCPNGTLFQQQIFNCDWWYEID